MKTISYIINFLINFIAEVTAYFFVINFILISFIIYCIEIKKVKIRVTDTETKGYSQIPPSLTVQEKCGSEKIDFFQTPTVS